VKILPFIIAFAITGFSAQSQSIISMTTVPANPTDNDSILFLVDVQFSSSGCVPSSVTGNLVGQDFIMTGTHCPGMLTAICDYTDSIKVGPMAAGGYNFNMSILIGDGMCGTPQVADNRIQPYIVTSTVKIEESYFSNISLFPNPITNELSIQFENPLEQGLISICDVSGRQVYSYNARQLGALGGLIKVDTEFWKSGVYFVSICRSGQFATHKILKN